MSFEDFNKKWLDNHFKAVKFIKNELEKKCSDSQEAATQQLIKFLFDNNIACTFSNTTSATDMEYFINRIIGGLLDDGDISFIEFGLKYKPMIIFMDNLDLREYLYSELMKNNTSMHFSVLGINWNMYHAITDVHINPIRFINSYENVAQAIGVYI